MWWFLLDASDSSLCIVFEKNILQAGQTDLNVDEEVVFFYQGKQYSGRIIAKSRDRETLDAEMNKILKESRGKKSQSLASKGNVSGKRKITTTTFYGNQEAEKKKKSEPTKMSEEEKTRQRILERNKKEAERHSNRLMLSKTSAKSKEANDPNYVPFEDSRSMDSDIYDPVAHDKELLKSKSSIMRKLLSDDTDSMSEKESSPRSPSKDELKKQLEMMRMLLDQQKAATSNSSSQKETDGKNQDLDEEANSTLEENTKGKRGMKQVSEKEENRSKDEKKESQETCKDLTEEEDYLMDLNSGKDEDGVNNSSLLDTDSGKHGKKDKNLTNLILDDLADMSNLEHLEHQLYGKASDTKELANLGVFCKADHLGKALSGSANVKHLLRRLMEGVFDPEKIENCTVTGRSWHAGGTAAVALKHDPLNPRALRAIVDFSNAIAKSKKWSRIKFEDTTPIFAIKLNEIKNKRKKALKL